MNFYFKNYFTSTDYNKKIKLDIAYIRRELLAEQKTRDGRNRKLYIKFSRILNGVTVIDLTKEKYIEYWKGQYIRHPEMFKQIEDVIEEKFENGLISKEKMIKLIKQGNDSEQEKKQNLKLLM